MEVFTLVGKIVLEGKEKLTSDLKVVTEEAKKTQQSFQDIEKVTRPLGIALTGIGAAGLMAANATKDWNNALGDTLQTLKPLFASLTAAGVVLMIGTKAIKAFRVALVALKTQAISTAAAFGVIGVVVGAIAIGLGLASSKTRDYTESIDGWDNALQSAKERLKELEDSGQGATKEAGDLRQQVVYLTDALQEFSDLEKTNVVTSTQLNEAWDKRTDLVADLAEQQELLTQWTERAATAAGGNSWETFYDNMKRIFFLGGSTTEEQRKAALAALADTSQNATEIYNNIIGLLRNFTLDELTGAYITANDELKKLISTQMELTAASELEELSKPINDAYELFVSNQEKLYGLRANETKSLMEQFEDDTDARQDSLNDQLDAVRKSTNDVIKQYRREYDAKVKLLDDETDAQVEALQRQLGLLDDSQEAADDSAEDETDAKTQTELELAVSQAWNRKDRATAEANLSKFLEDKAKKLADRQREAARESLQNQIRDVQSAADKKRTEYQAELDAKTEIENAKLEASEITIQSELDSLQSALITKRGILQQELNDAVTVQNQIRDNAIADINAVIAAQLAAANTPVAPITFGGGAVGRFMNASLHASGVPGYANGGPVLEDSLLVGMKSGKPYTMAHAGETVNPAGGGNTIINVNNPIIRDELDIVKLTARISQEQLRNRMIKGSFGS